MEVIGILALVGTVVNNLVALVSALGSLILLLGSFSKASMKKYGQIADWSILGLVFGWGFQISMAVTNNMPEQIGVIFPMSPLMVYALLSVSLFMVIGRMVIRRMMKK